MGSNDLRRLKWIGVGLPIVFVVAIESFRFLYVKGDPLLRAENVAIGAITVFAVVAFALLMFYLIERAQRHVVRQNRELSAVNAVSTAVQGEMGVEHIIDSALRSVVESTGAIEAAVTVFPRDGAAAGDRGMERKLVVAEHPPGWMEMDAAVPHLIDIPLTAGTTVVGRMRLHMSTDATEPDLLASATLHNIGHQLACSIQIGQLVADLQRRMREGHGMYDVLLRISNQNPLTDILTAVARHARDLLATDEAVLCISAATSRAVQLEDAHKGTTTLVDGTICISADPDRFRDLTERQLSCPVRSSGNHRASVEVTLTSPDGTLGELWLGRTEDVPYTTRDRDFLRTLGELASIAVTSARMRETERHGAVLGERERIAREMHDSLAQVLGVAHLRLRALGSRPEVLSLPAIRDELASLADMEEEAYHDVRESILGLRESSRTDRGLMDGLRAYLDKYSRQSGVTATLETGADHEPQLEPRHEIQVIRVIQEALTNVRKHSGASTAIVRITQDGGTATICVEDDGCGFVLVDTLLDRDHGFGLHTMRERMELIGGTLSIDSAPGRGTRVIAKLPGVPRAAAPPTEVNGASNGSRPGPARR
jgi:signal transduction histidine kinase